MKGVELSTTAIILIILGLIILLAFFYLIITSKGQVDVIQYQTALRNCCGDRSIWDCDNGKVTTTFCKVPWSDNTESLSDLAGKAGVDVNTQLCGFCFCPNCPTT